MRNVDCVSDIPKPLQCRYNEFVECYDKYECYKCGWNPVVAEARLARLGITPSRHEDSGFGR